MRAFEILIQSVRVVSVALICSAHVVKAGELVSESEGFGSYFYENQECITSAEREAIFLRLEERQAWMKTIGLIPYKPEKTGVSLVWPVVQNPLFHDSDVWGISNFVDHNPNYPNQILDYFGGNRSYDTTGGYNHSGIDIFLWPWSWDMMRREQGWVVAAAPGIIIDKDDGFYDQNCSLTPQSTQWNAVYISHADGSVAWYGHLKSNSLTEKGIGESVDEGEFLGVIGSSGYSTGPHLHFELYDSQGQLIDPFSGPFNTMNSESWWQNQHEYYNSKLLKLMTHDSPPQLGRCPDQQDANEQHEFDPGELMYLSAYYRDQRFGQKSDFSVFQPDGKLDRNWSYSLSTPYFSASYYYIGFYLSINAPEGIWYFESRFEGETLRIPFRVGKCQSVTALTDTWPSISVLELTAAVNCQFVIF